MAQPSRPESPTRLLARQMRKLREEREWSARQLAEAMTDEGVKWDRTVVVNLEHGRRSYVSVDEWLALARVLRVLPIDLLAPVEEGDMQVTPSAVASIERTRLWVLGMQPFVEPATAEVSHPFDPQFSPKRLQRSTPHENLTRRVQQLEEQFGELLARLEARGADDGERRAAP